MRSTFLDIEGRAKDRTNCKEYQEQTSRRTKRKSKYDHFSGCTALDDFVENQTPGVFFVFIDNILSFLTKHMTAYHSVFEVFRQLKSLTTEEILEKSSSMVSSYEDVLQNRLGGELVQFAELLKADVATVFNSKKQQPLDQ